MVVTVVITMMYCSDSGSVVMTYNAGNLTIREDFGCVMCTCLGILVLSVQMYYSPYYYYDDYCYY